ncbi:MAG: EAL domain-containing protein [Tahibacter sp.]
MRWERAPELAEDASVDNASTLTAGTLAALEMLRRHLGDDADAQSSLLQTQHELDRLERAAEVVATRYRSLINAVPDAVTVHDETGRIVDANAAACVVYGYPLEQLKRLTVFDLNPTLPRERINEVLGNSQPGETTTVETTNRRADGTMFPVEVHSNVYVDGNVRRIVAVARDITHRVAASNELRESESRYRALLHAMDKGVLVQNGDGQIASVNPTGCRLLGLDEDVLKSTTRETLSEWRFEDEWGRPLPFSELPGMRALRLGAPVESTLVGVYLPHQRLYRWLSISTVPQFQPGETLPFQVISTFGDVTALKRSSELFAKTQSLASIGGWELDLLDSSLFWTDEMFRIHDLPVPDQITVERALSFLQDDDREKLELSISAVHDKGQNFDRELRIVSATGRRRWVRVQGQPLRRNGKIHGVTGTLQDITARKLHEEQLRRQAQTDQLTGLANRDSALAQLELAINRASGQRNPALMYVDLDRFKIVNDMLGHAAGDRLLAAAADRLTACAGIDAILARFSGDDFLVMLPSVEDALQTQQMAERITMAFIQPFTYAGEEFSLTASVGIARYPEDGTSAQQMVNHADAAMLEAKRRGRNTWQAFNPGLARALSDRMLIESQLRRALDNGEFRLEYQPTIDLANNRVVAAEALLRWNSRQLGELGPSLFIQHAENSGDIVPIGAWVIREACRQLHQWRQAGLSLQRIAVNVSYRQLLSERLAEVVIAALREFDLSGDSLELEMTERVLIDDVADTLDTFARLRSIGVVLTIDDFGEGYSALNYLRRLPIDGLKISHSFMQGIPANETDAVICQAIVRIAASLGLTVTAEGVENEAQRRFLVDHGTPFAQGFLFSRSLAPARFHEFVEHWNHRNALT